MTYKLVINDRVMGLIWELIKFIVEIGFADNPVVVVVTTPPKDTEVFAMEAMRSVIS